MIFIRYFSVGIEENVRILFYFVLFFLEGTVLSSRATLDFSSLPPGGICVTSEGAGRARLLVCMYPLLHRKALKANWETHRIRRLCCPAHADLVFYFTLVLQNRRRVSLWLDLRFMRAFGVRSVR